MHKLSSFNTPTIKSLSLILSHHLLTNKKSAQLSSKRSITKNRSDIKIIYLFLEISTAVQKYVQALITI